MLPVKIGRLWQRRSPTWWCGRSAVVPRQPTVWLAAASLKSAAPAQFAAGLAEAAAGLQAARPTAVNLAWAVERMLNVARLHQGRDVNDVAALLWQEAEQIAREDVAVNKRLVNMVLL